MLTQRQQDERIGGQFIRIVQPGDTLYSIAFVAGLDVNKIATWNGIDDTSKLQAGQRIRLTEPIGFTYPVIKHAGVKTPTHKKNNDQLRKPKVSIDRTYSEPQNNKRVDHDQPSAAREASTQTQNKSAQQPKPFTPKGSNAWAWPLRGTLANRFNPSQGQQGINIQGQHGQVVKAAASGEVVYAGDSLKGYGNLVIIKHSSIYLSAYANNQSILIKEGDIVEQAQPIATLGQNSVGDAVAHFQIRKHGNPVDPMTFLR